MKSAKRLGWDRVSVDSVGYVRTCEIKSDLAYEAARSCLIDALSCGLGGWNIPLAKSGFRQSSK